MKLISITWCATPRLPGLSASDIGKINCQNPGDAIRNWKLMIRGSQVYFVSPAGWSRDHSLRRAVDTTPAGPTTVYGPIPLSDIKLEWSLDDPGELDSLFKVINKYESEPFGWKPAPVAGDKPILAQIPPAQLGDA